MARYFDDRATILRRYSDDTPTILGRSPRDFSYLTHTCPIHIPWNSPILGWQLGVYPKSPLNWRRIFCRRSQADVSPCWHVFHRLTGKPSISLGAQPLVNCLYTPVVAGRIGRLRCSTSCTKVIINPQIVWAPIGK